MPIDCEVHFTLNARMGAAWDAAAMGAPTLNPSAKSSISQSTQERDDKQAYCCLPFDFRPSHSNRPGARNRADSAGSQRLAQRFTAG